MKHVTTRCVHCQDIYSYQSSGAAPTSNDKDYCPTCKVTMINALKDVPKKREKILINSKDFTEEQVRKVHEEEQERVGEKQKQGFCWHRVYMSMIDLNDSSNKNIRGSFIKNGKEYYYSWWTKTGGFELQTVLEKDCETGKIIGPWDIFS